jgi:GH35 family endo-1,4-beta-xylanase
MTNTRKQFAFLCFCILSLNLVTSLFSPLLSTDNSNTALAAESMGAAKGNFVIGQGADSPFGLNVQAAARYGVSGRMQVPLDSAKNTGAGWNREEFRWDFIEPTANTFDFGFADEAVQKSVDRGLNVLGLLAYNVDRSGGKAQPSYTMPNLDAWKNYVNKVVTRYKDKIKYWEIWNEPSDPLYFNIQDPAQRATSYAQLLQASYQTIKGIDSSAKV